VLWPDFSINEFQLALDDFAGRERRFGLTGAQTGKSSGKAR
jgi:undecaprenyl diphosphate synthase